MSKKKKKEGLANAFSRFDKMGKRDSNIFFGIGSKKNNPYDMPRKFKHPFTDWEEAADEFFGEKKKKTSIMVNA